MQTNSSSLKNTARFAGFLYLIWIITGLFAMFYVPSQISTRGDAVSVAQNVLSKEFLFRVSIVNDLFSSALWVVLVLVLYRLFKSVNERQAKILVALVLVQIPITFVMGAISITSLMILKGELLKTIELTQRQDLALLFLKMNDYGTLTLEMFWGFWLFPLAFLVYRSRFLPRFLGFWLLICGIFYLILGFTSLLLPQYKDMVLHNVFALPAELGELAFMLWLVIMGAKEQTVDSINS
ncbi:MAG: DUF4386 domain-containing protein [Ignavibacteriales bacterium]|nr:DUF4386 domain-containing protein [Ignavibacteriales bacterium]